MLFLDGSSLLRSLVRRRRFGRYVAYVSLRVVVLVALVLRACLLVGHARACLWWVSLFFCRCLCSLSFLLLPFLPLSSSFFSLFLSASASGKPNV